MTIFSLTIAGVAFSGVMLSMGMFLKHVVTAIPEMTNINHHVCLSK